MKDYSSSPATVEKVLGRLAARHDKLHVCYEAGPMDMGFIGRSRLWATTVRWLHHRSFPKKSGERIKTNRRDAVTLARLLRAGELTPVCVPDAIHEAVRNLVRAREAAAADLRKAPAGYVVSTSLLRHGIFSGRSHWSLAH